MTAVEYLRDRYYQIDGELSDEDFEKAEEIYEEHIRIAYMEGAFEKMRHLQGKEFMMPTEYYNETFKQQEQCKCGQPKVGGYSCQRTDCNQNL
jgi:hypothetical protein